MKIVIEYVLIENLLINFFILKTTEKFIKQKTQLVWLNSLFGAIISLICPILNLTTIGTIFLKVFVGSVMVCISFDFKFLSKYLYIYFAFSIMTFAFGGFCEIFKNLAGEKICLICIILCMILYMCISKFLKHYHKQKTIENFQYAVRFFYNGNMVDEKGYFDSGNVLYDTITNSPIILISLESFKKITGENYYELLLKNKTTNLKNCHYIPASTSMSQGKMLVFEVDKVQIIDKKNQVREFQNLFLGISFADFEKSFNSGVLLHSTLI